jgi:hypothetical protein
LNAGRIVMALAAGLDKTEGHARYADAGSGKRGGRTLILIVMLATWMLLCPEDLKSCPASRE